GFLQPPYNARLNYAAFDFSNDNRFTGRARSLGYAGKLGLVYRVNDRLTVGAAYHSQTRLNDMSTDGAALAANMSVGGTPYNLPLQGEIKVLDFQWPATFGVGLAWRPVPRWMLAADVKYIRWADTMTDFKMRFTASQSPANDLSGQFGPAGDLRGQSLEAVLHQNWRNQTVLALGAAYRATPALTLRAGVNVADNPVPDTLVNPLFPAIVEDHLTAGFSYAFDRREAVHFSFTRALPQSVTNANPDVSPVPIHIRHAQWNWQALYSLHF
ncbi:MAG TPA: outer membrane protein transport protein, partial [Gammaproteobacteria bacterium]|nr:outer membrane protein transport protein [Gammaproteobacteria bacterium]